MACRLCLPDRFLLITAPPLPSPLLVNVIRGRVESGAKKKGSGKFAFEGMGYDLLIFSKLQRWNCSTGTRFWRPTLLWQILNVQFVYLDEKDGLRFVPGGSIISTREAVWRFLQLYWAWKIGRWLEGKSLLFIFSKHKFHFSGMFYGKVT